MRPGLMINRKKIFMIKYLDAKIVIFPYIPNIYPNIFS